jgi:diacylglycerol kinase (ATP)
MARKIIYFINPISGTQGKSLLKDLISRKTGGLEIDFEILYTDPTGAYPFLKKKIQNEGITDIVVCGGDGTVNAVAGCLLGTDINIGILPMGSGNGLANSAKIPRRVSGALDIVLSGKTAYVDGFYINEKFSCMLCGIGFDAWVAREFSNRKKRGLLTYIKVSLSHYFKTRPYPFEIILPESRFSCKAFFISIANSNQFGNHFTIAPKASLDDGLLDIVIVKKMNKFSLPFFAIRQLLGFNPLQKNPGFEKKRNILYFQTDSLTILNPEKAPLHIDGEPEESAEKFEIKIIRRAIRLIQP